MKLSGAVFCFRRSCLPHSIIIGIGPLKCRQYPTIVLKLFIRKAKQKAELDATSPKYVRSQYYGMRLVTRTEADMPEGTIGYDADEVLRKANAAKNEKEAIAI